MFSNGALTWECRNPMAQLGSGASQVGVTQGKLECQVWREFKLLDSCTKFLLDPSKGSNI